MKYSVELEPPSADKLLYQENSVSLEEEVSAYRGLVSMISITNRPVFGLSPVTMAKQVNDLMADDLGSRICVHLTTRLSHFDFYKTILDAHRMQLDDILPILGDPRGPIDQNYFRNGFDILGFTSYLKTGNIEVLSPKYQLMLVENRLVEPIPKAKFGIGSVVDLNPTKTNHQGASVNIRPAQIKAAQRKEKLGAEYLISQGIFNADYYFEFLEESDITIPIIPSVIPGRLRLIEKFGIPVDNFLKQRLRAALTTRDERLEGNKIAREILEDLIDRGVNYAHIYSLGNSFNFYQITGLSRADAGVQDQSKQKELTNSESSFIKSDIPPKTQRGKNNVHKE